MINQTRKLVIKKVEETSQRSQAQLISVKGPRLLGRIIIGAAIIFIIILFLPWRQTISGRGTVTALRPEDRPQTVQNQIGGRIERWAVREGEEVKKGDTILILSETNQSYFNPDLPARLDEQLDAKRQSEMAAADKISATDAQISALSNAVRIQLSAAQNDVKQSRNSVSIDSADLEAVRNFYKTSKSRLERYEAGYKNGLFSLTDIETRRLKLQEDKAKEISQENKLSSSRQALANAIIELDNIRAKFRQSLASAQSDRSSAVSGRASVGEEIARLRNEMSNVDIRRGLYAVRAPQDGYIVKTLKAGIGENIKEGESVATLQPRAPQVAVELYVNAMDVPLILDSSNVRLQFEGWPSVQFSGWPSVAVGTFGGKVSVIDRVSTDGKYRILVRQPIYHQKNDEPWPVQLRQGSGVYGRVILRTVPVWYEIWRQLNGFPPSLDKVPTTDNINNK